MELYVAIIFGSIEEQCKIFDTALRLSQGSALSLSLSLSLCVSPTHTHTIVFSRSLRYWGTQTHPHLPVAYNDK